MKREPYYIYIIGMCLGYISKCAFEELGIMMGVIGYFITFMVIIGMVYNDHSHE